MNAGANADPGSRKAEQKNPDSTLSAQRFSLIAAFSAFSVQRSSFIVGDR